MQTQIMTAQRVELEGCSNFRDIGGYACAGGMVTRRGRFYRSDCLSKLTDRDIAMLAKLKVRTVIDLRTDAELLRARNRMDGIAEVNYRRVSLSDGIQSQGLTGLLPESLSQLYVSLVDEAQTEIAEVFRALAAASGAVVFHCAAGKDRTGVVAAVLLLLPGVAESDIVADYMATYGYMQHEFERQLTEAAAVGFEIPPHIFRSDAETIEVLLRHIRSSYGSAEQFLLTIGLSPSEIAALKSLLTEDE